MLRIEDFISPETLPNEGRRALVLVGSEIIEARFSGGIWQTPAGKPLYNSETRGWLPFPEFDES